MLEIRDETPADYAAIGEVVGRAFGDEPIPELVDRLRRDEVVVASLVAVEDGQVVGHIMFTETPIETGGEEIAGAILSPLAVTPERQGAGIGSALVRQGIEVCRERGRAALLVLGHPTYYPRFGFSPELAHRVRSKYSDKGKAYMAMELTPGALANGGTARVPATFDLFE
ncbi:MAG TPA: N-acetyltransferase [Thermomicrobiales bacterium]|jgi:putative acetyltransferase